MPGLLYGSILIQLCSIAIRVSWHVDMHVFGHSEWAIEMAQQRMFYDYYKAYFSFHFRN
jgi:hypothetical protein